MAEVIMPRLSDSMEEGTIVRWLKQEGDAVTLGEPLAEVETDKATVTFEAEADGTLEILVAEGETVALGALIARIGDAVPSAAAPASAGNGAERVKASPLARRMAREAGIDLNGLIILLISGTASIDEVGRTVHVGDFRAQLQRTYENITKLLAAEGATWHDIVRTTCYLRDIERDYPAFNEERTAFFKLQGLDPLPASTGIQAILCRPDLLIEIEAIAMFRREATSE